MNKRLIILCSILIVVVIIAIFKQMTDFVYVSPRVNTSVFPYLANTIKPLDKALNSALEISNKEYGGMKYIYKNAYGSGFIIGNTIPNDLDYSVGVNLGKYKYDGKNADEIANDLFNKISLFQALLSSNIASDKNSDLYCEYSAFDSIFTMGTKRKNFVKDVTSSIDNVLANKEYVKYFTKFYGENTSLMFPFVLKSNEILIEDFPPVILYSDKIEYSKQKADDSYLRELTIVFDYSFTLEDVRSKQVKEVELVAESFNGQRMQLSRRFFVPIVFIGEESAKYLRNLDYLNNDDEYVYYRLYNYGRHLQEIQNLNSTKERPIKLLKRILQCLDLIYPVLDENTRDDIFNTVTSLLNSQEVYLLNNYSTAVSNLFEILNKPGIFFKAKNDYKLIQLLSVIDNSAKEMHERKMLSDKDYKKLNSIHKKLVYIIYNTNKPEDIKKNSELILQLQKEINSVEISAFGNLFKTQKDLFNYTKIFNDVYKNAGFHKVDLYWLNKNTLGVEKDSFTSKIPEKDLHRMALENRLVDVNYKFIDVNKIDPYRVRYSVWVRYNPTALEDENYQNLKRILLEDKKNFKIKKAFIF